MCKLFFIFYFLFTLNSFSLDINSKYGVLVDYDTNEILFSKNENEITSPSSTTKIMTAYIIFDMLESGKITLDDKFKISVRAWRQDGSRMFLEPEWKISVEQLLYGLIVVSGNDAAVALAEGSAGSIDNFVDLMNIKAKELGMKDTNFVNPTGLYDKSHFMSVKDLSTLSISLIKNHYKYYKKFFSEEYFVFNNIRQKNRNSLLNNYPGVDGLKTGFTDQGKYSISSSTYKDNKRLVAVVNGADTEKNRYNDIKNMFDYGYNLYKNVKLYDKNDIVTNLNVLFGKEKYIYAYTKQKIEYSTKDIDNLKIEIISKKYLQAPVKKNDKIAKLRIIDGKIIKEYDLYSQDSVELSGKFKRFKTLFLYNCKRLISI